MSQENAFFDQFLKEYGQLFPEKGIMLAMMQLLNKFANAEGLECEFSEQQLFDVLNQALENAPVFGVNQRSYTPREYLNNKVHRLLEHFLSRDERTSKYSFTHYALDLYRNVQKELFEKVNPVKVAGIFRTLLADLSVSSLQQWAEVTLPHFQNDVYQQLMSFDNDINSTLKHLRRHMNQEEQDFLLMLSQVSSTLDELHDQARALTDAFGIAEEIQVQVSVKRLAQETSEEDASMQQAVAFLRRARGKLGAASDRLERIRPRINALFSDLAKLRFDRNTERFLDYLLAAEPGSGKTVALPPGLTAHQLWGTPLRYQAVPRSAKLFPLSRVKAATPLENEALQAAHRQLVLRKAQQAKRVQEYLQQIKQALTHPAELDFTPYAVRIVQVEGAEAYNTLMQVIDKLVRELVPHFRWEVEVTPEPEVILQNDTLRITLWNLRLRNPSRH